MKEVEIKARITEKGEQLLKIQLEQKGFTPGNHSRQCDSYYQHPSRNFVDTDEALRLRQIQDFTSETTQTLITYKGPNEGTVGQNRKELECGVQDGKTVAEILKRLGFHPVAVVDKERFSLTRKALTICLDRVKGLGYYIEAEIICDEEKTDEAMEQLQEFLRWASFAEPEIEPATYLELIIRNKDN